MNYYILLPTVAFIINTFVWSYVLGQRQQDPVSRAFLILSTTCGGWILFDFLMLSPLAAGNEMIILKLQSIFWIPTGYLFMNFAHALVGRKQGSLTIFGAVVSVVGIIIFVFTDWIMSGYEIFPWGIALNTNSPPFVLYTTANTAFGVHSLWLIFNRRRTVDPDMRSAINLIMLGSFLAIVSIVTMNVIIPDILGIKSVPRFGSSALVIFIFIVFLAVSKHRFLAITADKVAEELFEEIDDGIVIINRQGEMQRANRRAKQIMAAPNSRDRLEEAFKKGATKQTLSLTSVTDEADERMISLSVSDASYDNETVGKIAILRDITDQKRAEDVLRASRDALKQEVEKRVLELRHAQKMEAIGTLAGGIAHDFNNILAAISGFTHAALQGLPAVHPVRSDLNEVIIASGRAREIVQQILTFSLPHDHSDYRTTPVKEIIDEALGLLKAALPPSMHIEVDLASVEGGITCNPTRISQVLINLGTNAFQAMKDTDGALLTIGVRRQWVDDRLASMHDALGTGEHLCITFRDNGPGMSKEVQKNIFDPFFTTKKQGEGTGLGLSTALKIVQDHDGAITVESAVGQGTCFSVYLPVSDELIEALDAELGDVPGGTEHIMVVDDESQLQRVAKRLLEPLGYRVTTFSNGPDALAHFQRKGDDFDLVITDQTMPQMTGLQLATHLLEARPSLPIILVSGYGAAVSEAAVKSAGIRLFLKKPIPQNILPLRIRELLDDPTSE